MLKYIVIKHYKDVTWSPFSMYHRWLIKLRLSTKFEERALHFLSQALT